MTENLEKIFLYDPLYTEYSLNDLDLDDIFNILFCIQGDSKYDKTSTLDSFCLSCSKDTTFQSYYSDKQAFMDILIQGTTFSNQDNSRSYYHKALEIGGIYRRDFFCPRKLHNSEHCQTFIFRVAQNKLSKIGQYPSIGDLINNEIVRYKKLDPNLYKEFNRSIGLAAHGIGIGAFVYLRRIIEKYIVGPELENLINSNQLDKNDIVLLDFKGKLKLLENKIPDFLMNNPKVYSILSKGIHELDEDECKKYFSLLRNAIEIILDERIEKIEKDKKSQVISNLINKI